VERAGAAADEQVSAEVSANEEEAGGQEGEELDDSVNQVSLSLLTD